MTRVRGSWICLLAMLAFTSCDSDSARPDGPTHDKGTPDKGTTPDKSLDGEPYPMGRAPASAPIERLATLEADASSEVSLSFRWQDLPGRPAEVDLNVGPADAPLFQVFASDGRPFARAGLRVVALQPEVDYQLRLSSNASGVHVALTHVASGQVTELGELEEAQLTSLPLSIGTTDSNKARVLVSSRVARHLTLAALP
jgi:hypothetical protein